MSFNPSRRNRYRSSQIPDPNAALNGPEPPEPSGFAATVKRYCTLRNGVITGVVVLLGTAVYLAVTRGDVPAGSVTT